MRDARRHRLVGLRARIVVTFGLAGLTLTVLLSMLTFHLARGFLVEQREELVTRQAFVNARLANDALAADVSETGVTVHVVDEGLDSGPVVAQERVAILEDDTRETLLERLHAVEHRLLPATVREWLR